MRIYFNYTLLLTSLFLSSCAPKKTFIDAPIKITSPNPDKTRSTKAYFAPRQGREVFNEIYRVISEAKVYVYISIYSLRDKRIRLSLLKAKKNGADVKVVLHPPLYKKKRIKKLVNTLEEKGIEVKIAKHLMHEKMIIIDDEILINSSANLSSGAKLRFSENWIFHYRTPELQNLFSDFLHEYSILWGTAKDVISNDEANAPELNRFKSNSDILSNIPKYDVPAVLYSSSMNFRISRSLKVSKFYKRGQYLRMKKRLNQNDKQTWVIRDKIIKIFNNAQSNISCSLNHLFIDQIADSLIAASKRNIRVRLTVDNQELSMKAKTGRFVKGWKKITGNEKKEIPVRVKFYSLAPSPTYWFLNHHKYCVVDYGTDHAFLINGSYNFSKTAEQKQFDNQVIYTGPLFRNLYISFQQEFEYLYSLNRNSHDLPNTHMLNFFITPNQNNFYPLHNKTPISLTWDEAFSLRKKMSRLAPGILKTGIRNRNCRYYRFKKYNEEGKPVGEYNKCPRRR